jgi:hydroxymethylbilane synthase
MRGSLNVTTITRCRIASDIDYLSKVQLEEVTRELKGHFPKLAVEMMQPTDANDSSGKNEHPASVSRNARLMKRLCDEEFDALVFSASSLPARLPSGLTIGAITNRLTPYDVLISSQDGVLLDELPENGSVIANGIRREAQLLYYRPDLKMVRAQGSVDSIIQKVKNGGVDGAVLAASDVERLHKQDHVVEFLTCSICVPAAGQGALAVLVRSNEEMAKKSIRSINDPASYSEITAEWAFLDSLGVEETAPVGVLGSLEGTTLELDGMIALPDGRERIRSVIKGSVGHEQELGQKLAQEIFEAGGKELLQELNLG